LCKFPPNFFSCSSHLKDCFTPQSIASNAGTFTGSVVRLISDIRAKHGKDAVNLHSCGRFELAENPSDISDITHIDLSGIESLEGDIKVFEHTKQLKDLSMDACCKITGKNFLILLCGPVRFEQVSVNVLLSQVTSRCSSTQKASRKST